jgi:hypothetical protein
MDSYLADRLKSIFYERTLETMSYYQSCKVEILSSLISAVKDACSAMKPLIDGGNKQKVKYLQFSYLLSAANMKKLKLKLDLYDARHYGDLSSDGGYWDFAELFPYIDEDIRLLRDELGKRFHRVMDYELIDIRLYYHAGVFQMMWAILSDLADESAFAAIFTDVFEPTANVLFGAYLDQSEIIATIGGKS